MPSEMHLTKSQSEAIRHVETLAASRTIDAQSKILQSLDQASVETSLFTQISHALRREARVELSFHPDRKLASGASVADELLSEGIYRNQFETAISNGSRSAHFGGYRYLWEQRMFGGVFDGCAAAERPKYGALNLCGYPDGSAPRFGSCYLGLRPQVSERTTFSYGDSVTDPFEIGTLRNFALIWLGIFRDIQDGRDVLALPRSTLLSVLNRIRASCVAFTSTRFQQQPGRALDHYVEAQVHGEIRLDRDVELIVVDPSFANSDTGSTLERLSEKYEFPLHYHNGFVVDVGEIPDDFRGPEVPKLAKRIVGNSVITAKEVGEAAASLHARPEDWSDWGTADETLQHIKQLWHVLVQYGRPVTHPSDIDSLNTEQSIEHSRVDARPRRPASSKHPAARPPTTCAVPTLADIQQFGSACPANVPGAFVEFHQQHGAVRMDVEIGSGLVWLWPLQDVLRYNRDYGLDQFTPGLFGIGTDGCGELYAIDIRDGTSGAVGEIPATSLEWRDFRQLASSFTEFAITLLAGTPIVEPEQ